MIVVTKAEAVKSAKASAKRSGKTTYVYAVKDGFVARTESPSQIAKLVKVMYVVSLVQSDGTVMDL